MAWLIRGFTQTELANALSVTQSADVLECTVDDLTGGSKPELPSEMDGITDAFIKAAELFVKTLKTRQLARKASNE